MLTVTKRFEFCYGHYLPGYDGKCRNLHGHNSVVEVEVAPYGHAFNGMVVDFSEIKDKAGKIIDELDHKTLNEHIGFQLFCMNTARNPSTDRYLAEIVPTAEVICQYLVDHIKKVLPGLVRLRVSETSDSWAEWRAE